MDRVTSGSLRYVDRKFMRFKNYRAIDELTHIELISMTASELYKIINENSSMYSNLRYAENISYSLLFEGNIIIKKDTQLFIANDVHSSIHIRNIASDTVLIDQVIGKYIILNIVSKSYGTSLVIFKKERFTRNDGYVFDVYVPICNAKPRKNFTFTCDDTILKNTDNVDLYNFPGFINTSNIGLATKELLSILRCSGESNYQIGFAKLRDMMTILFYEWVKVYKHSNALSTTESTENNSENNETVLPTLNVVDDLEEDDEYYEEDEVDYDEEDDYDDEEEEDEEEDEEDDWDDSPF